MTSKRYKKLPENTKDLKPENIDKILGLIKSNCTTKFNESIDLNFKLSPTINIGLGGTSQLWHNVLSPLDKEDFEKHSWMPNSGWCISKITLDVVETSFL